jgi:hypothetical protein
MAVNCVIQLEATKNSAWQPLTKKMTSLNLVFGVLKSE